MHSFSIHYEVPLLDLMNASLIWYLKTDSILVFCILELRSHSNGSIPPFWKYLASRDNMNASLAIFRGANFKPLLLKSTVDVKWIKPSWEARGIPCYLKQNVSVSHCPGDPLMHWLRHPMKNSLHYITRLTYRDSKGWHPMPLSLKFLLGVSDGWIFSGEKTESTWMAHVECFFSSSSWWWGYICHCTILCGMSWNRSCISGQSGHWLQTKNRFIHCCFSWWMVLSGQWIQAAVASHGSASFLLTIPVSQYAQHVWLQWH